jgi:hypothetical protein
VITRILALPIIIHIFFLRTIVGLKRNE